MASNESNLCKHIYYPYIDSFLNVYIHTVDPVYSEGVGAAKSVHLRRVFTIKVFNLTIN